MQILLTGATGFIGAALVGHLLAAGHRLRLAVRDPAVAKARWPGCEAVTIDFADEPDADDWRPLLAGVDVVINAVGLFREATGPESGNQRFETVHVRAPMALFDACLRAGVVRVIQLSAMGADEAAVSPYHLSKKKADDHLLSLPLQATVVQPSLVFGEHGASSRAFLRMAARPLLPLPAGGRQCVQPVHVDDLAAAVTRLVDAAAPPRRLAVVGPRPLTLRDYLQCLRSALGLGRLHVLPIPMPLSRLAARVAEYRPGALLSRDALAMLERGNCADAAPLATLLGRPPRGCDAFMEADGRRRQRDERVVRPALGWLRLSLAAVWIGTAIVSLGVFPIEDSLELLRRSGVPLAFAPAALVSAAVLDLVLGLALLLPRRGRWLYVAQIALILLYTAIITVRLPEFWLHPYAPMLKNLPMLAALALLLRLDTPERR